MHRNISVWFIAVSLGLALTILGCRAAAPTATPVPPTPTKAPAVAPTVAPAPTIAPAPTRAPAVAPTVAPAPTATTVPAAQLNVPQAVKTFLVKYPNVKWYTDLPLPTTPPKYGGTYVRSGASAGSTGSIPHWDPRVAFQGVSSGAGTCYGGFLRTNVDRFQGRVTPVPLPDAAESWKLVDDLTWEFKLNSNVFWHDRPPVNGRRVTAEDLKWNIEQYRDKSIYAGSFKTISDVIIKDPSTIVIKTSQPYAHILHLFGSAGHVFTAPEMEAQTGGAKTWCIGYGPFKLVEYQPDGPWTVERNPKYHIKGHPGTLIAGMQLPFFDRIEVVPFPDAATQIAAFISGRIASLIVFGINDTTKSLDSCGANCQGSVTPQSPATNSHIAMRLDKPPFNDVRVRRALSMGIDRQAIIDTAYQGAAYTSQQIPLDAVGWDTPRFVNERGKYLQFNPTEAKRLLAEAGYPNGFKTSIENSSQARGQALTVVEMIQFQWKQNLNVDAAFKPLEPLTYSRNYQQRLYEEMTNQSISLASTMWDTWTYGVMHSKSPTNFASINDPEVDKWAEAQRTTFDVGKQREANKKLFDLEEENIYRINTITQFVFTMWNRKLENANGGLYPWLNSFASRSIESAWFKE